MKESIAASTILVPLDGSPLSERALPYAERLAEATSARLVLIRVVPLNLLQRAEDDLDLAEEAHSYLRTQAERIRADRDGDTRPNGCGPNGARQRLYGHAAARPGSVDAGPSSCPRSRGGEN